MKTITAYKMRTPFFVRSDRDRQPRIILNNKVPMGVYLPCEFDEDGLPQIEQICQQIRDLAKDS